jgi:hypothetical protein
LVIMPIDSSDVKNYIKRKLCSIAGFCWLQPLKFTVILLSTLKLRPTGATLTQLVNFFFWEMEYFSLLL